MSIRLATLGESHPSTADALGNLGLVHLFQDSLALLYFERTLAIRELNLGSGHPKTVKTQELIAAVLAKLSSKLHGLTQSVLFSFSFLRHTVITVVVLGVL